MSHASSSACRRFAYRPAAAEAADRGTFIGVVEQASRELYDPHAHLGTSTPRSLRLVPTDADPYAEWPFLFVDPQRRCIVGSGIYKGAPSAGWVEIGYGIAASEQGRGVGTEAVFALVRFAFEQAAVHTVHAETSVGNHASQRVVRKVGLAWAGTRTSDVDGPLDCWFVEAP